MTSFDTVPRAILGEDCLQVIREFVQTDVIPESPFQSMAQSYLDSGSAFGELEARLTFAILADTIGAMDARIKALERDEV